MTALLIEKLSCAATVQDAGRFGHLMAGVTWGGCMDGFSHRLGQRLVGNNANAASIEMALGGMQATFSGAAYVAITGARTSATLNGLPVAQNCTLMVPEGAKLRIEGVSAGTYVYLSVSGGGFKAQNLLGSRSVVIRDGIGQPLSAGMSLPYHVAVAPMLYATTPSGFLHTDTLTLRFLPGFHVDHALRQGVASLESAQFAISNRRNRMAIATEGDTLAVNATGLWSEPTVPGAIQLPPDGRPLVLMADRQTVGGYPLLGAVLSPDCRRLSQASPGTPIQFKAISETEADRILWLSRNFEQELKLARQGATPSPQAGLQQ